jgi:hypothetical protein
MAGSYGDEPFRLSQYHTPTNALYHILFKIIYIKTLSQLLHVSTYRMSSLGSTHGPS